MWWGKVQIQLLYRCCLRYFDNAIKTPLRPVCICQSASDFGVRKSNIR